MNRTSEAEHVEQAFQLFIVVQFVHDFLLK